MKRYPKIYLAVDNCFASKRWTQPIEWMELLKQMGIYYVEASADNECDPLYTPQEYIEYWINQVMKASSKTGVKLANLYSGHGTYSTLGLAHTDPKVRRHIRDNWLKKMITMASILDAGLGFFTHAFNQSTLLNRDLYQNAINNLIHDFTILANYAASTRIKNIGVEQMYTPHQIPWTINGAKELLRRVNAECTKPFYITIDVGHQSGQNKFQKPSLDQIKDFIKTSKENGYSQGLWLGTSTANDKLLKILSNPDSNVNKLLQEIHEEIYQNPHLFASPEDADPYAWIENLGCFSPIIHLQQTDGKSSSHHPFTNEWNVRGIIRGEKVLRSLKKSFDNWHDNERLVTSDEIYLTIEVFSSTIDYPEEIVYRLKKSVEYWRNFIPMDGCTLDSLID